MSRNKLSQKGVAMITALLVVALTTIMAVGLASKQFIDVRRASNMMQSDQAYLDALYGEAVVTNLLTFYRGQFKYDDATQFEQAIAALNLEPHTTIQSKLSFQASYPEARFNVNTLLDRENKPSEKHQEIFKRILGQVLTNLGRDRGMADSLLAALLDWMDEDEFERPGGAEDSAYETNTPPYKAANRMLTSISELRLVYGFDKELLDGKPATEDQEAIPGLLQYIDALPDRYTTINVNLVTEPLIFEAFDTYAADARVGEELVNAEAFKTAAEFLEHDAWANIEDRQPANSKKMQGRLKKNLAGIIDTQSSYFMVKIYAGLGDTSVSLNSLIYMDTAGTKLEVVSRAIGTDGI